MCATDRRPEGKRAERVGDSPPPWYHDQAAVQRWREGLGHPSARKSQELADIFRKSRGEIFPQEATRLIRSGEIAGISPDQFAAALEENYDPSGSPQTQREWDEYLYAVAREEGADVNLIRRRERSLNSTSLGVLGRSPQSAMSTTEDIAGALRIAHTIERVAAYPLTAAFVLGIAGYGTSSWILAPSLAWLSAQRSHRHGRCDKRVRYCASAARARGIV
jgi:hypothetical protein